MKVRIRVDGFDDRRKVAEILADNGIEVKSSMRLFCSCGKEIEGYDDFTLTGEKIWECECGKKFICDELKD